MIATCAAVGGVLWILSTEVWVKPSTVHKSPNSDIVYAETTPGNTVAFDIAQQHQLRMGTDEYIADCLNYGYTFGSLEEMKTAMAAEDSGERTGVDD